MNFSESFQNYSKSGRLTNVTVRESVTFFVTIPDILVVR